MADSVPEKQENLQEMPFYAHFAELRSRLVKSLLAIVVGAFACFAFAPKIYAFMAQPILDALPESARQLIFLNPIEPFFVYLKVSVLVGFMVASPFVFFQIWRFIAPALYAHEKKAIVPLVASSTLVFALGAVFCYCVVLPVGLKTLVAAGMTEDLPAAAQISMEAYFGLMIRLIAAFGIVFEMPIFSFFLTRLGVITHRSLVKHWRGAIVAIFILAALLTPPDVLTQVALGLPMCLLYAVSIGVARLAEPKDPSVLAAGQ